MSGPPKTGKGSKPKRGRVCPYCLCIDVKAWADEEGTVCVECTSVAAAWAQVVPPGKRPELRAFVRGYWAASGDERSLDDINPFRTGDPDARYWQLGADAAAAAVKRA